MTNHSLSFKSGTNTSPLTPASPPEAPSLIQTTDGPPNRQCSVSSPGLPPAEDACGQMRLPVPGGAQLGAHSVSSNETIVAFSSHWNNERVPAVVPCFPGAPGRTTDENEWSYVPEAAVANKHSPFQRLSSPRKSSPDDDDDPLRITEASLIERSSSCSEIASSSAAGASPRSPGVDKKVDASDGSFQPREISETFYSKRTMQDIQERRNKESMFQASVSEPTTISNKGIPHTTYIVRGCRVATGLQFCQRKRYSDFEWLRLRLCEAMPGILVPTLPAKQLLGRFSRDFVEKRRQALEHFVVRLLSTDYLANHSLVASWLLSTESDLVELKRVYPRQRDSMFTCPRLLMEVYLNLLLNSADLETDRRFFESSLGLNLDNVQKLLQGCRTFLASSAKTLKTLSDIYEKLAKNSELQWNNMNLMISNMYVFHGLHKDFLQTLGSEYAQSTRDAVLLNLSDDYQAELAVQAECPTRTWIKHAIITAKFGADFNAMLDAVSGVEALLEYRRQLLQKIDKATGQPVVGETGARKLLTTAAMYVSTAVGRRSDADTAMDVAKMRQDTETLAEWAKSAAVVFAKVELPKFLESLVLDWGTAHQPVIQREMSTTAQIAEIWRSCFRREAEVQEPTSSDTLPPSVVPDI